MKAAICCRVSTEGHERVFVAARGILATRYLICSRSNWYDVFENPSTASS
jgi:hypothetical protein